MTVQAASGPRAAWVGQTVSHYRVLRAVGGGGMGEVYEAEDLNLRRHVALKFLSASRERSPEAVQRLEREARAASALNHPHICTIHDIGEHDGERFIAMELLEGETVRDRIRRGPLDVPTLLTVAIDVADALDAAHRAHVVHRDVTPSNVFLTRTGHAKLLDFGLAKEDTDQVSAAIVADMPTRSAGPIVTSPGTVVGTVAYMSPEQVSGEDLDHRTDLFSFGAVLYEMATGTRTFKGKTSALVFDAILHATPRPARDVNPSLPSELQPILDRALEKDRQLRYHSAEELRRDLERLRRNLDAPWWTGLRTPRSHGWSARVIASGLVLLLAASAYWAYAFIAGRVPPATPRQITAGPGVETDPAISPDGTRIAFTSDESGTPDIWIADRKSGVARRLIASPAIDNEPAWFPDGRGLAFVSTRSGRAGIWWVNPLDSAVPRLLIDDGQSPAISPDGTQVAFVRLGPAGFTRIAVAPTSALSHVTVLTTDRDGPGDHTAPSWSPDGRRIAYTTGSGLRVVSATGGESAALTVVPHDSHPAWSPNGRYVYFTALSDEDVSRIWRVPSNGGTRQPLTTGSGTEVAPVVSPDGRTIAFSSDSTERDIGVIDRATAREARFGSARDDVEPTFAPDGRAVYFVSERLGAPDIWVQPLSDMQPVGDPHRVFDRPGDKLFPSCSPDGRWLAYYAVDGNRNDIWIGSTAGGEPFPITDDGTSADPAWSPDGSAIAFISGRDGTTQIWTQQVREGRPEGTAVKITSGSNPRLAFPTWSPDGLRLACVIGGLRGAAEVGVVSINGGRPVTIPNTSGAMRARWDARSGALLVTGLWGTTEYQLRTISTDGKVIRETFMPVSFGRDVFETLFDVSFDGRYIVTTRTKESGHVWVLETQGRSY